MKIQKTKTEKIKINTKYCILLFLVAFGLRFGLSYKYNDPFIGGIDSHEYYYNSWLNGVDPVGSKQFGYTNWYERTPFYTLYLHITHRSLIIQMLLSAFGVILLFRINQLAGLLWAVFPGEILMSFSYMKESFVMFQIILLIYIGYFYIKDVRWKTAFIYGAPLIIFLANISYGSGILAYNHKMLVSGIWAVDILWRSHFTLLIHHGVWISSLTGIAFICLKMSIIYFIISYPREIETKRIVAFIILYTFIFALCYSDKYKFLMMPNLILYFSIMIKERFKLIN